MNNPCLLLLDGMELQLGLALPGNVTKGSDLNRHGCQPKMVVGSDPVSRGSCLQSSYKNSTNGNNININKRKRSFDEAFEPLTLPLLFWNNQPNEEDDPTAPEKSSFFINENEGGGENVVGWPPIKYWRKKKLISYYNHGGGAEIDLMVEHNGGGGGSNSKYVKVKMEGVAITRKVDLSLHHSYQTLTETLLSMFGKCQENVKSYRLTYQDREGDWLLAGDIPWQTFVRFVLRLKLLRTCG